MANVRLPLFSKELVPYGGDFLHVDVREHQARWDAGARRLRRHPPVGARAPTPGRQMKRTRDRSRSARAYWRSERGGDGDELWRGVFVLVDSTPAPIRR